MPLAPQGMSTVLKRKGWERIVGIGAMIDSSAWLVPWLSFEICQWAEYSSPVMIKGLDPLGPFQVEIIYDSMSLILS